MNTIKVEYNTSNKKEILETASSIISNGGLVVFPTETVYGIGGNALNGEAIANIYKAKGRPSDNPLIIHLYDKNQVTEYASEISDYAQKLMDYFWPGPLTMVFKKTDKVKRYLTGGLDTVAIRVPANEIVLGILEHSKLPICAPSANTSGRPSSTTFDHVVEDLDGKVEMIINGGKSVIGIESTVLDVTTEQPVILRPGKITKEDLETVLGIKVRVTDSLKKEIKDAPKAPGMKYKHYAPKGELEIVRGNASEFQNTLNNINLSDDTCIIASTEYLSNINHKNVYNLGSITNLDEISQNVFAAFRYMDEVNIKKMYIQLFDNKGFGVAINNRILKASSKK